MRHRDARMTDERLVFSIVRYAGGDAVVTVEDRSADRYVSLPESAIPRLRRVLPSRLFRLVQTLVENMPAISYATSFWTARPPGAERASEAEFVRGCERLVPESARRNLHSGPLSEWLPSETAISEEDIRACVELGLYQWRQITHSEEHRCTVCGGAASRLLAPVHRFENELRQLLVVDPWRSAARGDYERFARPEEKGEGLRVLLDVSADAVVQPEERTALEYLARQSPDRCAVLVLPGTELPAFLARIPAFELSTPLDIHGEEHLHAQLPSGYLGGRKMEVGTPSELENLAKDFGGGERGIHRARVLRLGREFAHLTVTTDRNFLDKSMRHGQPWNVVAPRVAMNAYGLLSRRRNHLPMPSFYVVRDYFYEERTFALVPEIASYLAAAHAVHGDELADQPEARLCWSAAERLTMMARAEDEIAFLVFLEERDSHVETLYHFEYLLLLARALIEGLARLAATVHNFGEPGKPLRWKELKKRLRADGSPLGAFLAPASPSALSRLVSSLRNPIAHAQRWPEIHHASPGGLSAKLVIAGADAAAVATAIRTLGGNPESWGVEGRRPEGEGVELHLDPYPFAVHLNIFLSTFAARFLTHLAAGAGRQLQPVPAWQYVNPPMNEEVFKIVRLMTWSPLEPAFLD